MKTILLLGLVLCLPACISVPDVYLIDRHTVMESEASGEWPELEKRFLDESISKGPANLAKEPKDNRKKKAFKILNGETPTEQPLSLSKQ